ncbi:hypothetical protein G3N18_15020 [Microbacterium sp. 2C]|uniref:hypothetical protein n=1 Tax=Microbacterium paulum TaxID=2707006 RepID=UPI0018C2EDC9|nr:hypothetical protein [Microbacterium paulum]MBG0719348.1 hypothetical protein [Microbacterium paulum]
MSTTQRSATDAASTIDAVQDEVASKFQHADAAITVRRTGYFNHTYAPDLVLQWRGEKEERHVFIRTSDSPIYLAEDIELARDRDPIFVPLGGLSEEPPAEVVDRVSLATKSRQSRALIAEAQSIDALADDDLGPIGTLAARAVLQGGSGVIPPGTAAAFGSTIASGFEGALLGDVTTTSDAIRESTELLDDRRTAQLAELLQAAWIGGGQIGTAFPGIGIASTSIQPEALKLLLDTVEVDDVKFWSRLAQGLQLTHFAGITISEQHAGFQMLMKAAAPRLKAKGARAVDLDGVSLPAPKWAVSDGRLSLAILKARVEFVARSIEDFASDGVDASPSVRVFTQRAQDADLKIMRVTLSSGDRRLDYSSEDGTSVTGDDRLIALESDIGADPTVLRASVEAEGREVGVQMQTATASGHTRSLFYVSTLARTALPLLTELGAEGRDALNVLFEPEEPSTEVA